MEMLSTENHLPNPANVLLTRTFLLYSVYFKKIITMNNKILLKMKTEMDDDDSKSRVEVYSQSDFRMADRLACLRCFPSLTRNSACKVNVNLVTCVVLVLIQLVLASSEKTTLIEVTKLEKTTQKRLTAGDQRSGTTQTNEQNVEYRFFGKLLAIGREENVDGRLHMVNILATHWWV